MTFADTPTLVGERLTLEPLSSEHTDELAEAAAEHDLHRLWVTRIPAPEAMGAEIERRLALQASGEVAPWAIRSHADDRAIEALGAKQDGVLRNQDLWQDGTVRDVVVYSSIVSALPAGRCPRRDSNPHCSDFKSPASAGWATGAGQL